MIKNVLSVDRSRLQRTFVSLHDLKNPRKERWEELGHWYEGFEFRVDKIVEADGLLREQSNNCGAKIDGTAEPAQNGIADFTTYERLLNGTVNFAMLVGPPSNNANNGSGTLWIFRLIDLGGGVWQDNRVAVVTDVGYGSRRDKAYTRFSGWIPGYERYHVKSLVLKSGKLITTPNFPAVLNTTSTNLTNTSKGS